MIANMPYRQLTSLSIIMLSIFIWHTGKALANPINIVASESGYPKLHLATSKHSAKQIKHGEYLVHQPV